MKVTAETQELAKDVLGYLREHPEKHDQGSFVGMPGSSGDYTYDFTGVVSESDFCDTTLCAAGAAVFLARGYEGINESLENGDFDIEAGMLLGLDENEQWKLFFTVGEEKALQLLEAIAEGDEEKFKNI
jgi:hypothetical protein